MKKQIFALFTDIEVADQFINEAHQKVGVSGDEVSYVYRNQDGERVEGTGNDVADSTVSEGAVSGAGIGGAIGAALGIVGSIGVLGPLGVITAGPLAATLGLTGAAGVTAATALTGAVAGGLIGALTSIGVGEPKARTYEERVKAGDVLVSVHAEDADAVIELLQAHNAAEIEIVEEKI